MRGDKLIDEIVSSRRGTALHPELREFLTDHLGSYPAVRFGGQWVFNSLLPPYPSRAFDAFIETLDPATAGHRRLCSVSLAVTNRCKFACWDCYNAGRSQEDVPLAILGDLCGKLQDLGAVLVAVTGGEPLLRDDLEEICTAFDDRSSLVVNTTGLGLSAQRARGLKESGVFAVSISLESDLEDEHDRLHGRCGAFEIATRAIKIAREAGLYPYVLTTARRELIRPERFMSLLAVAGRSGAMELRFVEPIPVGRLAGERRATISGHDRRQILQYHQDLAGREDLPTFSASSIHATAKGFGCQAGRGHVYIDGSGEVCPCNFVPLSFGNIQDKPLEAILDRMGRQFPEARTSCAGRFLAYHLSAEGLPTPPDVSEALCAHLANSHKLPRISRLIRKAREQARAAGPAAESVDRPEGPAEGTYIPERPKMPRRRPEAGRSRDRRGD